MSSKSDEHNDARVWYRPPQSQPGFPTVPGVPLSALFGEPFPYVPSDVRIIPMLPDRDFKAGDTVQHFKGGLHTILAIGTHTETNEKMVVYQSLKDQKIWIRPYDMFISKVDKEKYPDAVQPYRLIKVKIIQED